VYKQNPSTAASCSGASQSLAVQAGVCFTTITNQIKRQWVKIKDKKLIETFCLHHHQGDDNTVTQSHHAFLGTIVRTNHEYAAASITPARIKNCRSNICCRFGCWSKAMGLTQDTNHNCA
jgi:hypothetical protein